MFTYDIALLPGDGIGPEIMDATLLVLDGLAAGIPELSFNYETYLIGADHYLKTKELLPEYAVAGCKAAHAILLSAVGIPEVRFEDGTEIQPQIMIGLRKELDLYAAVRPVKLYPGVKSPLGNTGPGIDMVVVRENTEGLFASFNGGAVVNNQAIADTMIITRRGSERVIDFAFRLARRRSGRPSDGKRRVTCVDKANIFRSLAFFRKIFDEVAVKYPEIGTERGYVDAMTVHMLQRPWDYDVMVMENMFGDILSDLGAGLVGGLGLGPSAEIGDDYMLFQPSHGSAPDIAGQGIANPMALILSAAMMLDSLGDKYDDALAARSGKLLDDSVAEVLAKGEGLTPDLGGAASTDELANTVLAAVRQRINQGV